MQYHLRIFKMQEYEDSPKIEMRFTVRLEENRFWIYLLFSLKTVIIPSIVKKH